MIYRRRTYQVLPEQARPFTAFFEEYLLPNHQKHGARLVGRYVNEPQTEIMALFEYDSYEAYERIQAAIQADPMHEVAQARRQALGPLYLSYKDEFLTQTGPYRHPHHIVGAAALVTDEYGAVLLVQNRDRRDTWEMPGGQVEEGEPPHLACAREVLEETGLSVRAEALTGAYFNESRSILNLVFRCQITGGAIRTSDETVAVGFYPVEEALHMITRPQFRTGLADALSGRSVSYESFRRGEYPGTRLS